MSAGGEALAESDRGEGILHCASAKGSAPVLRDHLGGALVLIFGMAGADRTGPKHLI
jgi:hypothetical protein